MHPPDPRPCRPRLPAGTLIACAAALLVGVVPATAQQARAGKTQAAPVAARERLDAVDHAHRLANRALVGVDIGAPELPPVYADSPRDDIRYADRFGPGTQAASPGDADKITVVIPAGEGGTGTPIAEILVYQLPDLYDELGPPHPMVIAYHGYGASPQSVGNQSTLDEEANARDWIYLSVTGMDDQIFGTGPSQQNTEAAIQYMLDNFHVDPDRLYMIGFSMGAGVSANFTAQHRDPDGIMIAALGLLCGTYDWTMAYTLGSASLKTFMEVPLHFGGSPATVPFEYQRYSTLHFDPGTYPPVPGTVVLDLSMVQNLAQTPVYVTWDTTDSLVQVTKQNPRLVNQLTSFGGVVESKTVASTFDPNSGQFAPHSWLVLDEADLFDFFEDKSVDRRPASFRALLDEDGPVSWMAVSQRQTEAFSALQAASAAAEPEVSDALLSVTGVDNCIVLDVDLSSTPIVGDGPIDFSAASVDGDGFMLLLNGAECPPAYLYDTALEELVAGVDFDPLVGTLSVSVASGATVAADAVCEPDWTTRLWITPKLLGVGDPLDLMIDAPEGTSTAWMIVGFTTGLSTLKGFHVTIAFVNTILFPLPLGIEGDLLLTGKLPNDPSLSGLDILLQCLGTDAGGLVVTGSNMWIIPVQ